MTQTIVRERVPDQDLAPLEEPGELDELDEPEEPGLILGRPVEDRAFEAVEAGVGLAAGIAIGSALGGPIGAAVGGLVGAAGGLAAGEVLERAEGRAATTTNAAGPDRPEPR